jgi:TrmH family RNA methyltransferase
MIETLASERNPLFRQVRKAASRGMLTDEGYAVGEGFHLLEEALDSGVEIGAVIAAEESRAKMTPFYERLEGARVVIAPRSVFASLTTTEQPQGVIALIRPRVWTLEDIFPGAALAVVLDGVQDPGNAGAAIRSAEAFGATGAVFLKGSVNPYNPKCLRGSAGSIFRIPVVAGVAEADLPEAVPLYAAIPRAPRELDQIDLANPCAIAIGAEGRGISERLAARAVPFSIPTNRVESLNAAVACGVILYEAKRQRSRA